ncbi:MAG: serine hydrolase [Clostridia bacterium]|nr:serine hydrolase [Clostridia bacterium]
MTRSTVYTDPRVSKRALNEFFAKFQPERDEIHTLQIFHNDAMVVRIAPAPYSPTDKREIYSLSKSFCSTAIGFLVDEGKVSLDDRIVDLFPDKLPETVSENLAKMRVKHVLSMNTGHRSCVMYPMVRSDDAARAFLAQEVVYEPGTHFAYNTGATCLLSCIVERITGMKLVDFLTWKLFLPLGITDVRWNRVPDGTNEGGCGIHVCSDDIAKLGLLYLHKGVWNGRRLLSEAWVNAATSPVSDNSMNGTPDWCAGYGFQFWCNYREGFRGDGAFGQLCVVLPEHNMVFAIQTELGDMQREMDAVMELAEHLFDEDDSPALVLPVYAPIGSAQKTAGFEHTFWRLDENPMGWTGVYFVYDTAADEMQAVFSDGVDQYVLRAGNGHHTESMIVAQKVKPKLVDLMSTPDKERCRTAASYSAEDGKLTFKVRFLNCPHRMLYTITADGDTLNLHFENRGLLDREAVDLVGHKC